LLIVSRGTPIASADGCFRVLRSQRGWNVWMRTRWRASSADARPGCRPSGQRDAAGPLSCGARDLPEIPSRAIPGRPRDTSVNEHGHRVGGRISLELARSWSVWSLGWRSASTLRELGNWAASDRAGTPEHSWCRRFPVCDLVVVVDVDHKAACHRRVLATVKGPRERKGRHRKRSGRRVGHVCRAEQFRPRVQVWEDQRGVPYDLALT
jgi:hypothetical protein